MNIKLHEIAGARSGDKGRNSNVGLYFYKEATYKWAKINITTDIVKKHKFRLVRNWYFAYLYNLITSF